MWHRWHSGKCHPRNYSSHLMADDWLRFFQWFSPWGAVQVLCNVDGGRWCQIFQKEAFRRCRFNGFTMPQVIPTEEHFKKQHNWFYSETILSAQLSYICGRFSESCLSLLADCMHWHLDCHWGLSISIGLWIFGKIRSLNCSA